MQKVLNFWGTQCLRNLIEGFNCHHPTSKFITTWSAEKVAFLDKWVNLKNDKIETDHYVEPTDKYQCLWMDSCHPAHYKTAIPNNQALPSNKFVQRKKFI